MRNRWNAMLLVGWVLCASTAMAEPDAFGLGTGRDGVLTVTEPGTVVNRYAQVTSPLAPGDSVVSVSAAEGFAAGDLVMVLQTAGILPEPRQGSASLITLRGDSVGQWELARIGAVDGQKLKLTALLVHSFSAVGAQVISVPEFTDVRVQAGASLVAVPWDGKAGGVLAFLASGTIHNEGALDASGAGFQGGRTVLSPLSAAGCGALPAEGRPGAGRGEGISVLDFAVVTPEMERATNGGGGGLCPASGGGGGGNGAAGGRGGDMLTYGGDALGNLGGQGGAGLVYSLLDHLTLGGGGGQGYAVESYSQAGAGGGAIFIRGYQLLGGGTVTADGTAGDNASHGGAGGGGAGGSVYLRIADLLEGSLISARGGAGGNAVTGGPAYAGPGGGGGGGRILYQAERAPAFTGSVDAGLAGAWHFASTSTGSNIHAQPTVSQAAAYRGAITHLAGGFEEGLDCADVSGRGEPTPVFCTAAVEPLVLDTAITGQPADPSNKQEAVFYFTGSGGANGFDCALGIPDGGVNPYPNCDSPATFPTPVEGRYGFQVRAKNGGNVDPEPASYGWTVDLTPPDTHITSQPDSATKSREAIFTFDATEEVQSFDCVMGLNSNPPISTPNCTSPMVYSNLVDGNYGFQVRAKDKAGNDDPTPASYGWVVDNVRPVTSIDQKPSNPSNLTEFTFLFSGAGPSGKYWCTFDSGSSISCDSGSQQVTISGERLHTFCVIARDAAGNDEASPACHSWVLDWTPPTTVLGPIRPSNPTNATNATFTFSGAGTGGKYWCEIDGKGETSCEAGSVQYAGLEGKPTTHTFCVAAQDAAGNKDPSRPCYTWVVDLVAPDTLIGAASKPSNPSNSNSVTFTYTGAGPEGKYWCNLDGETPVPCDEGSKTYDELTEESHTFCVAAQDAAGNKDTSEACYTWTVDQTPPDTVIEEASKPSSPTNSTRAAFRFSGAGTGGQYWCNLDGIEEFCNSGARTYTSLTEGPHTFCVYATDAAKNIDANPDCYSWVVDLTSPDTLIDETSKPRNPTNVTNVTFRFSGAGPGGGYECKLSPRDSAYIPCDSESVTYKDLDEGGYIFSVYAVDAAGNKDEQTPDTYSWQVDLTQPETTIDEASKPSNPTNSTSAMFTFKDAGPGGKYWCQRDEDIYRPCDAGFQRYDGLGEGKHTFSVYAQDAAGNVDTSPATYPWVVDLTPPDTVIDPTSKPLNPTNDTSAQFRFSGAGPGGRYRCHLDEELEDEACDAGFKKYQNLGDRLHTFCVYAVDAANNRDLVPDCYEWRVDTTPPDTKIDDASKPHDPTKLTSIAFRFTGSAESVSFWCKLDGNPLDGKPVEDCSSGTYSKSDLAEGPHNFCVYARDAVGNADVSPDCYSWRVDLTPPDTVIDETSEPSNPTNSSSATFRFSGAGQGGRYWCRLDDEDKKGDEVACDSGSKEYNSLSEGRHTFYVYAVDAADNRDLISAFYFWEVDKTRPETTIDKIIEQDGTPGRSPTNATNLTFYFSGAGTRGKYSCKLDQFSVESCDAGSMEYDEQKLTEGSHTFSVYAQDEAGNSDLLPAQHVFIIDRTKPIVVVKDPQFNPITKIWRTNKTSPPFTGTSEPLSTVFLSIDGSSLEELTGADDKRDWRLETVRTLSDGKHTVSARAIDSAGNKGEWSNLVSFIVDTVPPDTKITDAPERDFNSRSFDLEFEAPSEPPELIKTTTFECRIVALNLNNKEVVDKCSSPQAYNLAEKFEVEDVNGKYEISVVAIDEAGNRDPTPAPWKMTVSVTPPAAPEITVPTDGEVVYNLTPKVSGKAAPGGTVKITIKNGDSASTAIASVGEGGEFEFVFPAPLEEGSYQLTAITTDTARNPSVPSESRSFTVLTPKEKAHAIGGGLGCAASTGEPWLALLGLTAGAALRSRRRRSRDSLT
jgi:hypothetical protein